MAQKASDKQIISALKQHGGNRQKAAEELGYNYKAFQRRVKKSERLTEAANEAVEMALDMAEETVQLAARLEQIQLRNIHRVMQANPDQAVTVDMPSTRNSWQLLRTKGKARGYAERSEVTGKDGDNLQLVIATPPQEKTADDWAEKYGAKEPERKPLPN